MVAEIWVSVISSFVDQLVALTVEQKANYMEWTNQQLCKSCRIET